MSQEIDLASVPEVLNHEERSMRLDNVSRLAESLRALTTSDAEFADVARDLGPMPDPYGHIADHRFSKKDQEYPAGRYNSSKFPAFYLGGNEETCIAEAAHWRLSEAMKLKQPVVLEYTSWEVKGRQRSLLPFVDSHPDLVSSDYRYCQRIGLQASKGVSNIIWAPSARHLGHRNTVVFKRDCVRSLGGPNKRVRLRLDGDKLVKDADL